MWKKPNVIPKKALTSGTALEHNIPISVPVDLGKLFGRTPHIHIYAVVSSPVQTE